MHFRNSNFRKGVDPCARAAPMSGNSKTSQDYKQPNVDSEQCHPPPETNDINNQYAELREAEFAGYMNPISK